MFLAIASSAMLVSVLVLGYFLYRKKHHSRKRPVLNLRDGLGQEDIRDLIRAEVKEQLRSSSGVPKAETESPAIETPSSHRRLIRREGEKA